MCCQGGCAGHPECVVRVDAQLGHPECVVRVGAQLGHPECVVRVGAQVTRVCCQGGCARHSSVCIYAIDAPWNDIVRFVFPGIAVIRLVAMEAWFWLLWCWALTYPW